MDGPQYLSGVLLLALLQGSFAQISYTQLLQQFDENILKVPSEPEERFLQVPLDIEITSDSPYEQCVEAHSPYCYTQQTSQTTTPNPYSGCSGGQPSHPCYDVHCTSLTEQLPLKEYETDFEFDNATQPVSSMLECGLIVEPNALYFDEPTIADPQQYCNSSVLPSIVVNITEQNATISFKVQATTEQGQFLWIRESPSSSYGLVLFVERYPQLILSQTASFSIVMSAAGYFVFSEGEVKLLGNIRGVNQISVYFGSEDFRGSITNITFYNVTATTNEIYSMYSGEPLATNVFRPDCTCPRAYVDSFGLISPHLLYSYPYVCFDGLSSTYNYDSQRRYEGNSKGKWDIFATDGWVSDFTTNATILLKMPQPMLTYAVSGSFTGKYADQKPKSMKVSILGPSAEKGAIVYISHNCEDEYGIPRTELPQFTSDEISNISTVSRRRRAINAVLPKCYSMDDVIINYDISAGIDTETRFEIPILHPGEIGNSLSDAYLGDVSVELIGYADDVSGQNTNWYYLGGVYIATRPHCGGYDYHMVGAPTTMSAYYNFHKPNGRAYTCHCPQGITGDMCESCGEVPGLYRYMKELDGCADCDCSNLTRANAPQCNITTGQCNCSGNPDLDLAGRQCHWYISDITPQYGPIAGGTRVVIEGGYISGYNISFSVLLDNDEIPPQDLNASSITFTTPSYHTANTTVDLIVQASTTLDIGSQTKFFKFEYRPNPVLEDIEPRTTILSGGKILTVSGKFFDSVYAPQMITYLRQSGVLIETFATTCEVITSTTMYCPTANMSVEVDSLLEGELSTDTTEATPGLNSNPTSTISVNGNRSRRSVSSSDKSSLSDNNDIDFTLGFVYDGYNDYEDLAQHPDQELYDLSRLYVYKDPTIFEQKVLEFKPAKENAISIKGERLDYGVGVVDYEIAIGVEYCEVIDLTSNQITCKPPEVQPQVDGYNYIKYKDKQIPHVKVEVGNIKISVGHVYYITSLWAYNTAFRISMIVLIVVVCVLITVVVAFLLAKRSNRKQRQNMTAHYTRGSGDGDDAEVLFGGRKLDENIQANVDRCIIPHVRVRLNKKLGRGSFGSVYKGQMITPSGNVRTVAVKTLKDNNDITFEGIENFLAEGTAMIDFKHENVLSLVGVVAEEGERPLVVLPYMENGGLCTFIRKDDLYLVLADILHFGFQIANGMSYLAKQRFVHRDLAARNCMVDSSYIVKIAAFGMSRNVYEKDYYKMEDADKPLPMKWMAVESLKEGRYTTQSDVWSYGVTLWELFTRGCSPYPEVENNCVKEYVSSGHRLEKPSNCPPIIYEMMCKCWEEDPDKRPSFDEFSEFIGKLLRGETIPTDGPDKAAGYYHARSVTKDISDDYLDKDFTKYYC